MEITFALVLLDTQKYISLLNPEMMTLGTLKRK